jgi:inosine-uridine nucleoside N-ribohydrolase
MVGLEVTSQALVSLEDASRLAATGTPWAVSASKVMEDEIRWFMDNLGWEGGQIYDACAVAAVVDPDILETRSAHVDIELQGELTRGRTVADMVGYHNNETNVDVGVKIDRERFMQILFEGLK